MSRMRATVWLLLVNSVNIVYLREEQTCRSDRRQGEAGTEEQVSKESCQVPKTAGKCDGRKHIVKLASIEESSKWIDSDKMFFVETSDRPFLPPRSACAVESAIGQGAGLAVIVAMTSKTLDLSHHATCLLYNKFSETSLFLRHIDVDQIFEGTAIEHLHKTGILGSSIAKPLAKVAHYSDAIRDILIFKYGGF